MKQRTANKSEHIGKTGKSAGRFGIAQKRIDHETDKSPINCVAGDECRSVSHRPLPNIRKSRFQFIVPFPPGDLEDVLTRQIAEGFQNTYNVSAAVVNKPGGGGGPFPGVGSRPPWPLLMAMLLAPLWLMCSVIGPGDRHSAAQTRSPLNRWAISLYLSLHRGNQRRMPHSALSMSSRIIAKDQFRHARTFRQRRHPDRCRAGNLQRKKGFKFSSDAPFDRS